MYMQSSLFFDENSFLVGRCYETLEIETHSFARINPRFGEIIPSTVRYLGRYVESRWEGHGIGSKRTDIFNLDGRRVSNRILFAEKIRYREVECADDNEELLQQLGSRPLTRAEELFQQRRNRQRREENSTLPRVTDEALHLTNEERLQRIRDEEILRELNENPIPRQEELFQRTRERHRRREHARQQQNQAVLALTQSIPVYRTVMPRWENEWEGFDEPDQLELLYPPPPYRAQSPPPDYEKKYLKYKLKYHALRDTLTNSIMRDL
jgi:hypothetical protein